MLPSFQKKTCYLNRNKKSDIWNTGEVYLKLLGIEDGTSSLFFGATTIPLYDSFLVLEMGCS